MTINQIYLVIIGLLFILWAVVSFFCPKALVSKKMEDDFAGQEKIKRRYLRHQRINLLAAGVLIIAAPFLPERWALPLILPLLGIVVVCVLVCNKINLGRWIAYKK